MGAMTADVPAASAAAPLAAAAAAAFQVDCESDEERSADADSLTFTAERIAAGQSLAEHPRVHRSHLTCLAALSALGVPGR